MTSNTNTNTGARYACGKFDSTVARRDYADGKFHALRNTAARFTVNEHGDFDGMGDYALEFELWSYATHVCSVAAYMALQEDGEYRPKCDITVYADCDGGLWSVSTVRHIREFLWGMDTPAALMRHVGVNGFTVGETVMFQTYDDDWTITFAKGC